MSTVIYEDVIPSLIENCEMKRYISNGVWLTYNITPKSGYVLHDNEADFDDIDPISGEMTKKIGFKKGMVTCSARYNFFENPRGFYAVHKSTVEESQIF